MPGEGSITCGISLVYTVMSVYVITSLHVPSCWPFVCKQIIWPLIKRTNAYKTPTYISFHDKQTRGFHVYRHYWKPIQDEILTLRRDIGNRHHTYAMSVKKGFITVGHMPAEIARIAWFFVKNCGSMKCQITSTQRQRSKIEKGGLEIPCDFIFTGNRKYTGKLPSMLKRAKLQQERNERSKQ